GRGAARDRARPARPVGRDPRRAGRALAGGLPVFAGRADLRGHQRDPADADRRAAAGPAAGSAGAMSGPEVGAGLDERRGKAGVAGVARKWADGELGPGLALWRRLAELGVTALAVPEKRGGLGADPADLVAACEELGHHAVPGPVAESLSAVPVLLAG